jgi:hypothetical protein
MTPAGNGLRNRCSTVLDKRALSVGGFALGGLNTRSISITGDASVVAIESARGASARRRSE